MLAKRIWKEELGILVCKDLPIDLPWAPHTVHYKVVIAARDGGEVLWARPYRTKQEAVRSYYSLVGLSSIDGTVGEVTVSVATVVTFNSTVTGNAGTWLEGGNVCPIGVSNADYLVIGGGGRGGSSGLYARAAGGGGGGGFMTGNYTVEPGRSYALNVGVGGRFGVGNARNSVFGYQSTGMIVGLPGGWGGSNAVIPNIGDVPDLQALGNAIGGDGGSGGGGGTDTYSNVPGAPGVGHPGQGFDGGWGNGYLWGPEKQAFIINGGGGGGAGGLGCTAVLGGSQYGGNGGPGKSSLITGVDLKYAGGGGGSQYVSIYHPTSAGRGTDGGGNGAGGEAVGGDATGINRGCGGGGAFTATNTDFAGGAGSDGVIVLSLVIKAAEVRAIIMSD